MRVRFGPYTAVVSPVSSKSIRPISSERANEICRALDFLPSIFGNTSWSLTGGLVVPLTVGYFYRDHDDLDIALDERDLLRARNSVAEHSYGLFSRVAMAKISGGKKIDIYKEPTAREILSGNLKHPRFVKLDNIGSISLDAGLLSYIDVYPYRLVGNKLVHYLDNISFSATSARGTPYVTLSGHSLPMRSVEYFVNCGASSIKHEVDVQALSVGHSFAKQH